MTISDAVNKKFLITLFRGNEIVSVPLPTFHLHMENIYSSIKTLVITNPFTEDQAEKDQLGKILSACKLQQGEFAICTENCSWSVIRKYENIRSVLLFGVSEKQLNITCIFTENQITEFDNRKWVRTFPLSRLMTDTAAKNALWQQALKPLFIP